MGTNAVSFTTDRVARGVEREAPRLGGKARVRVFCASLRGPDFIAPRQADRFGTPWVIGRFLGGRYQARPASGADGGRIVPFVDSGQLELDWLVTHRKPLADIEDALDLLAGDAAKVLLVPE